MKEIVWTVSEKKNTELEGRQKQVDKESLMWELYVQGKRSANNEVEIETKNIQENMKDRQNRTNIRATGDPKWEQHLQQCVKKQSKQTRKKKKTSWNEINHKPTTKRTLSGWYKLCSLSPGKLFNKTKHQTPQILTSEFRVALRYSF